MQAAESSALPLFLMQIYISKGNAVAVCKCIECVKVGEVIGFYNNK